MKAVKWIYQKNVTSKGISLDAGQKPCLCFKGRKHMLCVGAGHPVRIMKRPVADFDECRTVMMNGLTYDPRVAAEKLALIGARNGITRGALTLLRRCLDSTNLKVEIDEDVLINEEETIMAAETATPVTTSETTTTNVEPSKKVKKTKSTADKKGKSGEKIKPSKTSKNEKKVKALNDGLGRQGSITRFFNEGLLAGKSDESLTTTARKRFPDNVVRDTYVKFCRSELIKKGLLKPAKAA